MSPAFMYYYKITCSSSPKGRKSTSLLISAHTCPSPTRLLTCLRSAQHCLATCTFSTSLVFYPSCSCGVALFQSHTLAFAPYRAFAVSSLTPFVLSRSALPHIPLFA